ncbi:MAG: glycosyltransferase 87 family protein [Reyranella sp.]|nr:glycosyltransferase 87 family protein [Reyranella sp.]MDP3159134.1 glycosyltransferase 87 family protein [Reyranella sp.]
MGRSILRATFRYGVGRYGVAALASLAVSWLSWHVPGTIDVETYWLPWLAAVSRYGLIEGFTVAAGDYPPGAASLLFLARWLLPTADGMTVLKALLAAAQLGSTLFVLAQTGRLALSLFCLAAVALSASMLAYLDILMAIPLLVAFFAALDRRPILSAAAFGVACLIKWQPLVVVPFMLVIWFEQARPEPRRHLAAAALLAIVAGLVAWMFWPAIWSSFAQAFGHVGWSAHALNFPWFVQIVLGYRPEIIQAPGAPLLGLRVIFAALYLLLLGAAIWMGIRRQRGDAMVIMPFALAAFLAYFTFAAGVHENHLFGPMLLAFVLWSRNPRFRTAAIALAIFANLNLAVFYGLTGAPPFATGPAFAWLTGILSAFSLLLFAHVLSRLAVARRIVE